MFFNKPKLRKSDQGWCAHDSYIYPCYGNTLEDAYFCWLYYRVKMSRKIEMSRRELEKLSFLLAERNAAKKNLDEMQSKYGTPN